MSIFDLNDYSTNFSQRGLNFDSIPEFAKSLWGMVTNKDSNTVSPVNTKEAETPEFLAREVIPSYVPNMNNITQGAYMNSAPTANLDNLNAGIKLGNNNRYYSDDPTVNFIMQAESNGRANAYNPSSATGLFQITDSTHRGLIKNHPELAGTNRTNANDNFKLFSSLYSDNAKMLERAGIPINTFTLYGMHQQGPQFIKIYKYLQGHTNSLDGINEDWMAGNMPSGSYVRGDPSSWANAWIRDIENFNNKQGRWSK